MIFFVNSILLLVQRILLRNIDFLTMLEMVLLSMPQFLIYTFPFATLSGSAMVLGDLSSNNELLALKSSGVKEKKVFLPLIIWSLVFSLLTFFVSDFLLPWSNTVYRERLTLLMRDMPTFEIEPNATNTIGNIVIANRNVEDRDIYDIVMTNTDRSDFNQSVVSEKGTVEMVDPSLFVYRLDLSEPEILLTDSSDISSNLIANAEKATFYLDFSDQVPNLTSTNPVNLSSSVLRENIAIRNQRQEEERNRFHNSREESKLLISNILKSRMSGNNVDNQAVDEANASLLRQSNPPLDFYAQYSLGTFKLRYGKLTGFALSLIIAVAYWYMMFFSQLEIFSIHSDPYFLIFLPDFAVAGLAFIFMKMRRRMDR